MVPGLRYCPLPGPSPWPVRALLYPCWPLCLLYHLCVSLSPKPWPSLPPRWVLSPLHCGTWMGLGRGTEGECGPSQEKTPGCVPWARAGCLLRAAMFPRWPPQPDLGWRPCQHTTWNTGVAYRSMPTSQGGPEHRLFYLEGTPTPQQLREKGLRDTCLGASFYPHPVPEPYLSLASSLCPRHSSRATQTAKTTELGSNLSCATIWNYRTYLSHCFPDLLNGIVMIPILLSLVWGFKDWQMLNNRLPTS